MELFFSILLGAVALWALYNAIRGPRSRGTVGYVMIAIAAVVQIININREYSLVLSIITTIALLIGIALARRPTPGASSPHI